MKSVAVELSKKIGEIYTKPFEVKIIGKTIKVTLFAKDSAVEELVNNYNCEIVWR